MSKERELLVRCRAAINIRYDQVMLIRLHHEIETLLGEVEELLEQPEQEPLSDKDVGKGFLLTDVWHRYESFIAGVRWAEQQHGIGGEE